MAKIKFDRPRYKEQSGEGCLEAFRKMWGFCWEGTRAELERIANDAADCQMMLILMREGQPA